MLSLIFHPRTQEFHECYKKCMVNDRWPKLSSVQVMVGLQAITILLFTPVADCLKWVPQVLLFIICVLHVRIRVLLVMFLFVYSVPSRDKHEDKTLEIINRFLQSAAISDMSILCVWCKPKHTTRKLCTAVRKMAYDVF